MSAEEIKNLSQLAFVDGMANHRAGFLNMEVRCKQYAKALLDYARIQETLDRIGDLGDAIEALADEIKLADQSSQRRMVELTVQQAMQLLCAIYDRQKILERCMMYRKAFSAYPELHKTDIAMLDDIEKGSKDGN